ERAEDDTEDQLAPKRRPVAVARLGIEVVFAALPVAVALVVVMVWRIVFQIGVSPHLVHSGSKLISQTPEIIDQGRQILDLRRQSQWPVSEISAASRIVPPRRSGWRA